MNTCNFCSAKLGANLLLPEFPVGRRLAFDPSDARLWAVCPTCARWNLTWLDEPERRAAVARLDQYFAATPAKTAAAGIAVAEVGKTELIRIGAVTWATFASWRYARRLFQRRTTMIGLSFVVLPFAAFLWLPQGKAFLDNDLAFYSVMAVYLAWFWWYTKRTIVRAPAGGGATGRVRADLVRHTAVQATESGWRLFVKHVNGVADLHGKEALRALSLMLPLLNHKGASRKTAQQAIAMIEASGGPEHFIADAFRAKQLGHDPVQLSKLPPILRVALEIAVNEEAEKGALRGDLAAIAIERDSARIVAAATTGIG